MKIIIIGFHGQLGMDCQKALGRDHLLLTPAIEELDLCDKIKTISYIEKQKADAVVNCAAYTAVDNCEKERELCRKINADGPAYLALACGKTGSRLIHISTDYVFDGSKAVPQPYTESDPVNPLSHYGRTKLEGEYAVQKNCTDYVILRTAWLYSANGPNFLKTMLRLSLDDPGAVRKVVDDQYGSLTWSHTLAKQIAGLLSSDIKGLAHATSSGYSTWYEAARYFLEKLEIPHKLSPCTTKEYPTPAHRPVNSILANEVLERHHLSVFTDWREDVDRFVDVHGHDLIREYRK